MAKTLPEASQALVPDLRDTIDSFADEDRRNFVDLVTLTHIGEAAIGLFASGIVTGAGEKVGDEIASAIIDTIKRIMRGGKPDPAATPGPINKSKAMSSAQLTARATDLEGKVRVQFETVLTAPEAVSLSAKLREQALLVIGDD